MAQARSHGARGEEASPSFRDESAPRAEDRSLLADDPLTGDIGDYHGGGNGDGEDRQDIAAHHSAHVQSQRTAHRVRFDLTPSMIEAPSRSTSSNGAPRDSFGVEDSRSDSFDGYAPSHAAGNRPHGPLSYGHDDEDSHHRQPLLTDIEAPSVALANSPWAEGRDGDGTDDADDHDVHEWAEQERQRPKSGLRMAFMNMANSIIGAGIIGQPYAFRQAGLLAGVALLVGLTFVVDWTICLIVINSKLSGSNSFQGTVEHCFGRPGLIAISVAQWAFAFGGMVAFGVIVGDTLPHVFAAVWPDLGEVPVLGLLVNRQFVIVLFVLGISYPLTLYRDIAMLAKASTLALISMGVIVLTVVTQGILTPGEQRGSFSPALLTVNGGIFEAIGVISFAFVCHHNSLLIYGSLKTPTIDRFSRVTHYSTGISMVFCLLMALAGFLTFGDRTLGNVLNNFPAGNVMVTFARLCFGLNMLTTLPLEAFVCREVMFNYFYPGAPFNMKLHLVFSTALVVSAMVVSLLTCDVGIVFELVGATSACAMAYILPPLCYIKLTTPSWRTYLAWAVVAFGSVVMIISLVQAVAKIISNDGEPAQCM